MVVGRGILYFCISYLAIQLMYYIGMSRSDYEITIFFLSVTSSIALVHLFSTQAIRFRSFLDSVFGIPSVSVVATIGFALAFVSALPVCMVEMFYASGVVLGLACGWIIVIWSSNFKSEQLISHPFYVHPSLLVAIFTYFVFRCIGSFSEAITEGFLFALPLISIFCIIQSINKKSAQISSAHGQSTKAMELIFIAAALFALALGVVVFWSGHESVFVSSRIGYLAFFEALCIALILCCCWAMNRFSGAKGSQSHRHSAILVFFIIYIPLFCTGLIMGRVCILTDATHVLRESNIWIVGIAVFIHDIRSSVYTVRGLAVGLMFEAMCMGQMIAFISNFNTIPHELVIALCLGLVYFAGLSRQYFGSLFHKKRVTDDIASSEIKKEQGDTASTANEKPARTVDEQPFEILSYCQRLANDHGLTKRETEVFGLIALGRSAKYISEELMISKNTTRTHIRHVYEKLNVNSKQELIDLVLFGSGVMS